ncbi:DMT family transporter [Litorivicinus lipolyticus]|uniref:DMT family transporter n=1 Tax=Litorivicinus lipolyticus TaxID=418701 RepID=UPI003B5BED52
MLNATASARSENSLCILYMVIAMAGFAVEDAVIKQLSYDMPVSQILVLVGICGSLAFAAIAALKSIALFGPTLANWRFVGRTFCELSSAIFFVSAIVYASLSASSAILQAAPLVVAMGGALFLGQSVSLRQWVLIGAGFAGVLLIIQPGMQGFQPAALLAVVAVILLAIRDLLTRSIAGSIAPITISFWAFFALFLAGVVTIPVFGEFSPIRPAHLGLLCLSTVAGAGAYFAVVLATRGGDVAVVAPFRYSRLVFALVLSVVFFEETVNAAMLAGSALVIVSGLATLRRSR